MTILKCRVFTLQLFGKGGVVLIVILVFMAVTSSGSAEFVAVSSLVSYDIYQTYINPNANGKKVCLLLGIRLFPDLELN